MEYFLPTSVTIAGREYSIRSDYRDILLIFEALGDEELSGEEKAQAALYIFYPDYETIPVCDLQEALDKCFWFCDCGRKEKEQPKKPKVVDFQQDFQFIVGPVNRIIGKEIRAVDYLHWWSFISAYYEIGDCTFAQIVRIRTQLAKGKQLSKDDATWYRENRDMVDFEKKYTAEDNEVLSQWIV